MQRDPERLSRAFDVVVNIISGKFRTPYDVEDVYKKAAPGIALEACSVRETPLSRFAPHPKFTVSPATLRLPNHSENAWAIYRLGPAEGSLTR